MEGNYILSWENGRFNPIKQQTSAIELMNYDRGFRDGYYEAFKMFEKQLRMTCLSQTHKVIVTTEEFERLKEGVFRVEN